MPRRPDLIKASLWAGLICLWVCLCGPAWSRAGIPAPVRLAKGQNFGATIPSTTYELVAPQVKAKHQTPPPGLDSPPSSSQPPILHWFSGGFLGSLLCYYVYGYPLSYVWQEVWPPGLLDFVVLAAFCYLGYRIYLRIRERQKPPEVEAPPGFLRLGRASPSAITVTEEAKAGVAAIQESDSEFDLQAFGEEIHLLLLELYEAWNREDLHDLNGRVKESLLEYLQMGLKIMFLREEISHLEDLSLEGITVTEAGVDDGKDFITVRFRGRLLDYVLDKGSGKLLLGSMAYPATFYEHWDLERPQGQSAWVLQDIREA
jgi:predicted lipid-binding transport protein (Tim44 family)